MAVAAGGDRGLTFADVNAVGYNNKKGSDHARHSATQTFIHESYGPYLSAIPA
jgi:hypothetical protein